MRARLYRYSCSDLAFFLLERGQMRNTAASSGRRCRQARPGPIGPEGKSLGRPRSLSCEGALNPADVSTAAKPLDEADDLPVVRRADLSNRRSRRSDNVMNPGARLRTARPLKSRSAIPCSVGHHVVRSAPRRSWWLGVSRSRRLALSRTARSWSGLVLPGDGCTARSARRRGLPLRSDYRRGGRVLRPDCRSSRSRGSSDRGAGEP